MSKQDNHNFPAKLDLRRHLLRKYHQQPFSVFDCCQGDARLWTKLRTEFSVSRYWGVDHIPKAGRLKIDSARVLSQPGWDDDVIDVDTYGSPWAHWIGILQNLKSHGTIFLTIGKPMPMAGSRNLSRLEMDVIGLKLKTVPRTITARLNELATEFMLGMALENFIIQEAVEAMNPGGTARYIGLRLTRKNAARPARENNKRTGDRLEPGAAKKE